MVLSILQNDDKSRKSDKYLLWEVWKKQGLVNMPLGMPEHITLMGLAQAAIPESVTRARRRVQQEHPNLVDVRTADRRKEKADSKGTFIFREEI